MYNGAIKTARKKVKYNKNFSFSDKDTFKKMFLHVESKSWLMMSYELSFYVYFAVASNISSGFIADVVLSFLIVDITLKFLSLC